jgi:hypothetical protein
MEAIAYKNLLLRLQANLIKNPAEQQRLIREADQLRDKAEEMRKAKTAAAQWSPCAAQSAPELFDTNAVSPPPAKQPFSFSEAVSTAPIARAVYRDDTDVLIEWKRYRCVKGRPI